MGCAEDFSWETRKEKTARCDVAAPAFTGAKAKLLKNGLGNVTFTGRRLLTTSLNPQHLADEIEGLHFVGRLPEADGARRGSLLGDLEIVSPSEPGAIAGTAAVRCDVAVPAITGAKLPRNGLENVTFNGR